MTAAANATAPVSDPAAATAQGSDSLLGEHRPVDQHAVLAKLRVQIISGHNLLGRDRNGKSDPYVVLSIPGANGSSSSGSRSASAKRQTPPVFRTVDPVWKAEEATFDFDITSAWLGGDEEDAELLTARPTLRRGWSGAASRYIVQPALKIPKGAAAGARVVGRRAPRPMRIKKARQPSSSDTSPEPGPIEAPSTSTALPAGKRSWLPGSRPGTRPSTPGIGSKFALPTLRTSHLKAEKETAPPTGSAVLNPAGIASAPAVHALEFVLWDKDRFSSNDYLGECSLPVEEWLNHGEAGSSSVSIAWERAKPISLPVISHRRREVSGTIQVKVGLVPASAEGSPSVDEVFQRLLIATSSEAAHGVRCIPADQSLGTAAATEAFIDDGLDSDSEEEEVMASDDESPPAARLAHSHGLIRSDTEGDSTTDAEDYFNMHYHSIADVPASDSEFSRPSPPPAAAQTAEDTSTDLSDTGGTADTSTMAAQTVARKRGLFGRTLSRKGGGSLPSLKNTTHSGSSATDEAMSPATRTQRTKVLRRKRKARKDRREFAFKAEMGLDIIGIVMMEVQGAADLPKWKNGERAH